ncbi:Peptidoglycan/LPS O-acetylase OafA/YrhL, contains acyltransferase and SGNH-hydrolase domains [Halogranum rubrum]|uniref:Peptidoglycan/LPS O-acetylase OafA/YrhL, contains acyltransferase and SGNH-hydrolase domains n=1 Tax=Halogranum rubrum TaxID=553466 RepID=A0A1I4E5Y5_9EURY|nr:acyltransferase [Halogranum rubrum]SFL01224.1 Peptidoglycan/LPS O-acetylase OafA/YrhL, contains acyltransferase and SGNH-hydrolase domains [Halogranum rubrum]
MSDRIHSIDTLRAVAIFFIVVAHVQPFRGFETYGNYVYFALDTLGQFDVPFFFATSGYFLAETLNVDNVTSKVRNTARKLGSLYLFGRLVSVATVAALALFVGDSVTNAVVADGLSNLSLLDVVYYGTALTVPLWFLTALFFAIAFVACFVKFEKTRYLLPVAALVHLVGILGTNYQMVLDVPFRTRDALFFGFFYVALGYQLNAIDWTPDERRRRLYAAAVGVFAGIQLVEQYAISYLIRDHTLGQEIHLTAYTFSTVFFVLAVFAYALSNPEWGKNTILPKVGRHALGIYLLHVPVFRLVHATRRIWGPMVGIDLTSTLLWQLLITPLVCVLSLAAYLLMAKLEIIELEGSHIPWLHRLRS